MEVQMPYPACQTKILLKWITILIWRAIQM